MARSSYPIYASDIDALSTPSAPVSVETKSKWDRSLAHGWLANDVIEPGFGVFAAQYDCHEAYDIKQFAGPGFLFNLNLGDANSVRIPEGEVNVPRFSLSTVAFDEPIPITARRGKNKRQERCGIWLHPEWIHQRKFERFDDSGIVARLLTQPDLTDVSVATPALLAAGARLFESIDFVGSLAGLKREVAALSFFAEAVGQRGEPRLVRPASQLEITKMMRVRDLLDSLAPDVEVKMFELAAQCGMSVRSLSRHFRQTFGTTVLGYIAGRRMEDARTLLERDGATIDQAAYVAGFAHATNFSAAFRRRYGYPPGRARGKA